MNGAGTQEHRNRVHFARLAPLCAAALALGITARAFGAAGTHPAASPTSVLQAAGDEVRAYNHDYPWLHYSGIASHNDIAHLIEAMASGKVKLQFRKPRGYLDSLLKALKISPTSQALVFSKTSLQTRIIGPATPRAIYFNDDTYVAWIRNSPDVEINTMDSSLGPVFYTLDEQPVPRPHFIRQTLVCLACHDSFSLQGGGVPQFLFLSAYQVANDKVITDASAIETTNATPFDRRWGGWYVTGKLGRMLDLGNLTTTSTQPLPMAKISRADVPNLDSWFDTKPYLTNKSDVVAVMVLESQIDVHNLVIHASYKSRAILERQIPGGSTKRLTWQQLPAPLQKRFRALLEPLVRGMLYVGAAKLPTAVHGTSGYAAWFQALGPFDAHHRSLRDLDLKTRIFKYRLSYLIYSRAFAFLMPSVKDYLYQRLIQILTRHDTTGAYAGIPASERKAILEILTATKPDFARVYERSKRFGLPDLAPVEAQDPAPS
ncbi:MAG: hypothetical protein ACREU3_02840 [Steroidobacteraceae bacterium]